MLKAFLLITLFSLIFTSETRAETIDKILESFSNSVKDQFKVWHLLYKREYTLNSIEAKSRFRIFKDNLKYINDFNAENNGTKLGLNQFSDLTNEEYKKLYTDETLQNKVYEMEKEALSKQLTEEQQQINEGLWQPAQKTERGFYTALDWTKNFLPPRNQKSCGSCWAFATSGAIEGNRIKVKGAPQVYLSTQQLVDCDTKNKGCNGGWLDYSFDYVKKNGIASDVNYPYKAKQSACNQNLVTKVESTISGFQACYPGSCEKNDAFYNLLKQGPLTIVIDAGSRIFQSYKSGILNIPGCTKVSHAIVAVGYGIQGTEDYWIVRNSWDTTWGMKGYAWVKKDDANKRSCFVAQYGWLPAVTK
jgi:C1A family cysteine protease